MDFTADELAAEIKILCGPVFLKYQHDTTIRDKLDENVVRAVRDYRYLGLDRHHRLAILDIGSGDGCFPFVCGRRHTAVGFDVSETGFYADCLRALGVPFITGKVEAFRPFTQAGRYHLVTARRTVFDYKWGDEEWDYFLKCIKLNALRDGGHIFLALDEENATEKIHKLFSDKYAANQFDRYVYFI